MDIPTLLFTSSIMLVVLPLARKFGFRKVTLLDYQRGIRYRRGLPLEDVGAGTHKVLLWRDNILWLDTRPIQVAFENQVAVMANGQRSVFGIFGNAKIVDVRKALYSARNAQEVPAFVLLVCARAVLNGSQATGTLDRDRLADAVIALATPKLASAGFELLSFRFSQLSPISARPEQESPGAPIVKN